MASDLISRAALLDIVENKYSDIVAGRYPFNIVAYDLSEIIKKQPTVGGWIPCSERKPGYDTDGAAPPLRQTLVTTRNQKGGLHVMTSYFCISTGRWLCEAENENVEVIAWMPPPEPYKAGDIDG